MTMSEFKPTVRRPIRIEADHPSLPGHFPGRPLVAGVILLEHVANALREWRHLTLACVAEAKFLAPLEPGQDAELTLTEGDGGRFRFDSRRDDILLARGIIEGTI